MIVVGDGVGCGVVVAVMAVGCMDGGGNGSRVHGWWR